MGRRRGVDAGVQNKSGAFFFFTATLLVWAASFLFEIGFNRRTELSPIIAGFCLYQSANWFIRTCFNRDPLVVNTSVSLLHSSLTSVSVISVLANQWMRSSLSTMFGHSELVDHSWPWAYSALCISCGYFSYDQLDMLLYHLYSGWLPSILVHHLVLLICFTMALYRNVTINYLILTLVCELHSVFLHMRKLRRMAGVRGTSRSTLVKLEWCGNWTTYVLARFASHVLITMKLLKDAHKFNKGLELPLALLGMAGMNLLNVFLGVDLFKAYSREKNEHRDHHE
ncbi:hypothetical protein DM860_016968 [Cuscuta australis]|uniref:TLC domain-containing protein n=1 Tax=Cuscuta australis TaxID=267555 RepID=A0A328E234_9ASTE|nr:hypothetical protein DM860_016968 [Cuscuta australis]